MYYIEFSKRADKDKRLLKQAGLEEKTKELLNIIREDPFRTPPAYEKLVGDLSGNYSRRINIQHRLVYKVYDNTLKLKDDKGRLYDGLVQIKRMWTHYE